MEKEAVNKRNSSVFEESPTDNDLMKTGKFSIVEIIEMD